MQQIDALQPQVSDLAPLTEEDYRRRHRRASELMAQDGIGALLLTCTPNQLYYTGINRKPVDRLFASIFPREGEPVHIVPFFEWEHASQLLSYGRDQARRWHEDEDPYAKTQQVIAELGLSHGTIAVDPETPVRHVERLRQASPSTTFISGERLMWRQQMIKDEKEIAVIRRQQSLVEVAAGIAYANLWEGETEAEFDAIAQAAATKLGLNARVIYSASFGANTAVIYGSKFSERLRRGMVIKAGLHGAMLAGYYSDMSRCSVFGPPPSEKFVAAHAAVREAEMACIRAIKPGVECGVIDQVARDVFEARGFGTGFTNFWHRVGHGYNLYGHTPHAYPFLSPGATEVLQENMVVSVEPGLYFPGEWGFNIENLVRVTKTGCEVFGTVQSDIHTPFGFRFES